MALGVGSEGKIFCLVFGQKSEKGGRDEQEIRELFEKQASIDVARMGILALEKTFGVWPLVRGKQRQTQCIGGVHALSRMSRFRHLGVLGVLRGLPCM